jgi:hypothetical protein
MRSHRQTKINWRHLARGMDGTQRARRKEGISIRESGRYQHTGEKESEAPLRTCREVLSRMKRSGKECSVAHVMERGSAGTAPREAEDANNARG